MIRTRDLLWFVVILVLLGLAILSTTVFRSPDSQGVLRLPPLESDSPNYAAELSEGEKMDRNANIERLRSLLAEGDIVESSPSVEDAVLEELEAILKNDLECGTIDSGIAVARLWPLSGVSVTAAEGMRVVIHTQEVSSPPQANSGVTTTAPVVPSANIRTLLVLPQFPVKAGKPTCLDSEIIGVTVNGSLMFNNDVVLYRTAPPNILIGYARDGFPIYGAYSGPVDECGGYDGPGGYRYTVVPGEPTFMKCFAGTPSSFTP